MITRHETYGRVEVDQDALNDGSDFVEVTLLNPRDSLSNPLTVGKVALKDQGSYKPKFRAKASRVEQYLPLVSAAVSMLKRPSDDWDELYAVGALALVEADLRYSIYSNNSFAAFAKPTIMGYIKNHQNPERTGTMNIVGELRDVENKIVHSTYGKRNDFQDAVFSAMDHMTKKQRKVINLLLEGHTEQNVADMLGISQQGLNLLKTRALQHVKRHLY